MKLVLRQSLLILTVCLVSSPWFALAQDPIKIGFVMQLSGPGAQDGSSTLAGGMIAAEEINAQGGVLGRKIEIIPGDTRGIPSESVNAFRKLVIEDKIVAAVCCWLSTATIATMPSMNKLRVPTVAGVAFLPDANETKLTWLFKFAHTPTAARRYVDFWVSKLGVKRVAFLARNDDWGRSTTAAWRKRLKELGGEVLTSEYYTPGEKDFYSYLSKIKALNPDAVAFVDTSAPNAEIVKQMKELQMTAKPLAGNGATTDAFTRIGGEAVEGVHIVTRYSENLPGERNKNFVAAFRELRGGDLPDNYSQPGYDAVYIIAAAIRRAGSTDPHEVRAELAKTDYVSLGGGRIRFDERHQAIPKLHIGVIRNGKRVLVQELDTSGMGY